MGKSLAAEYVFTEKSAGFQTPRGSLSGLRYRAFIFSERGSKLGLHIVLFFA